MDLRSLLRPELVLPGVEAADRRGVLRAVARWLAEAGHVPDAEALVRKLLEREELGTTAFGSGVAIPHCKMAGISEVLLAVATVPGGVEFNALDGSPVHVLFVVVSPDGSPAAHLQCLAAISKWLKSNDSMEKLAAEPNPEALFSSLAGEPTS